MVSSSTTPFHGEQYIAFSLTTRTWHDERIPLKPTDWVTGGAPASSSVMPWSVNTVKRNWVDYRQGTLREGVIDMQLRDCTSTSLTWSDDTDLGPPADHHS